MALADVPEPLGAKIVRAESASSFADTAARPAVVVAFSDPVVDFTISTPSVRVTGATVESVSPFLQAGTVANAYSFILSPTGTDDITFELVADQDCDAATGGICAADGAALAKVPSKGRTISGPVTVSFDQSSYIVAEGESARVSVILSDGPTGSVSVPITITQSNGTSGDDHSGVPGSLTFTQGVTQQTLTLNATQDALDDDDETVMLGFGALPAGFAAGANAETTVFIVDDDDPVVAVGFGAAAYAVDEGSSVVVSVRLTAAPERSVTVPLEFTNQGGANGDDYSGIPASVAFATGETEQTFSIAATADSIEDDGESVKLSLGALPTGVTAGANAETTVSVVDTTETSEIPWSATLTVGTNTAYVPATTGYSLWGTDIGTLSDQSFRLDGRTHRVLTIMRLAGGLYLNISRALPVDFTLTIGTLEFLASDSSKPASAAAGRYWWDASNLDWADGDTLEVSITPTGDGSDALPARPQAPPSAYFTSIPANHDGVDPFTFRLRFTDEAPMSFRKLRDEALEVTNGTATKAQRTTRGSNLHWKITVQPDSSDPVTIALPATSDCAAEGAICTSDGRKLSNSVEFTVPGPATSQ